MLERVRRWDRQRSGNGRKVWRSAKRKWLLRKVWGPETVDRRVCGVEGNSNSGAAGMALVKYPARFAGKVG